ncbi:hypothetical protein [Peribacillus kribbensis]|uniref:aldose epimerase family protein n=1 Tax=Peribacillus kribbensis TaxID=356658 RepID=UPI00040C8D96|nr:hypothetical protein [Peribacillus kribbensis]
MYQILTYKEQSLTLYQLTSPDGSAWVKIAPERGGIITGFGVGHTELLFLNEETLHNLSKNVRGGIPVLFPISGQLKNSEYDWDGTTYKMKNHGFARNLSWQVSGSQCNEDQASITLRIRSNQDTLNEYPFEFEVLFTYILTGHSLSIHQEYRNNSKASMPLYAGFHPYFKTREKGLVYDTDAKTYLDYNDGKHYPIQKNLDLEGKKESLVLLDAVQKEIAFKLPEADKTIKMEYGPEFPYIVLWAEEDQPFVCVEPWMALPGEMNRKEALPKIGGGEALRTFVTIHAI